MATASGAFRTPIAYGMVGSAFITGAVAASLALNLLGIVIFAAVMAVGSGLAVFVCSRWPGLAAPFWKLWPAAVIFNPAFLLGAGYSIDQYRCLVGSVSGWDCLFSGFGPLVCGLCLVPPLIGLAVRWSCARHVRKKVPASGADLPA